MSATKEVDDLVRAIKATGYDVRSNGGHHKVIDGAGKQIYVLPKSPSDRRWRENAVHALIREGVLESDPRKSQKKSGKSSKSNLNDPDVQAAKVAAIRARAARLAEATAVVRQRIQPLVNKVGGWGVRQGQITASEIGLVAMYWGRDRPDVFRSAGGARSSAQSNMKQGGACSESALAFWDAFVTAWEQADDQRTWYFDLVREMKGLAPIEKKVIIGGAELVEKPGPKKNLRRAGKVKTYRMEEEKHPLEPDTIVGQLALRAVMLMAAGRELTSKADQEEILEVGERILALEARTVEDE